MSRINLKPKDPSHEVAIGLDDAFNTFFISVLPKGDDEMPIEWADVWDRHEVVKKIRQYAEPCERREAVIKAILSDLDPGQFVQESI